MKIITRHEPNQVVKCEGSFQESEEKKTQYKVMTMMRCEIKAYNGKQQDGKTKK